jgi:hypothetical protein
MLTLLSSRAWSNGPSPRPIQIHVCEVTNEAEMAIGIQRASEFHELFDAALKKESEGGNGEQYLGTMTWSQTQHCHL